MVEANVQTLNPDTGDRGTRLHPAFVDSPNGQLLTIRHMPAETPRLHLLVCPPVLHEHIRSYRFFSMLANRLAARGVEVLRFDYAGTGDSSGPSGNATHASMIADIRHLFAHESRTADGTPLAVMGIRWGAVLASHALRELTSLPACAWWWQPIISGRDYVAQLLALDHEEGASTARYPWRLHEQARPMDELLGFRIPSGFLDDMQALNLVDPGCRVQCALPAGQVVPDSCGQVTLPDTITRWPSELEYISMIPTGPADAALLALLASSEIAE